MKRVGHLIEQVADMDNLLWAFYKAQRGKVCKHEVLAYRESLQDNLVRLRHRLLDGNLEVCRYHTFTIHDPKERQICAAAFDERVLHHALMRVCHPWFDRQLINDTYATRIGKGTYAALERAHRAMGHYRYVAKLDVRKYFDSVDHGVLKEQLSRLFKDSRLLDAFFSIIDTYQTLDGRGLPIGNLTSQYFANHYLSPLDHYAKENLRVPVYVRYMDDILMFGDDCDEMRRWVTSVVEFAMGLRLCMKPPLIVTSERGVSFLGYRINGHRIGLNSRSRRRFLHKARAYGRLLDEGKWNDKEYVTHIAPLTAFVQHAYTKTYIKRISKSLPAWLEPRESWWQLEQQREELPRFESQQQQPLEPQQQHRLPPRLGPLAYGMKTDDGPLWHKQGSVLFPLTEETKRADLFRTGRCC